MFARWTGVDLRDEDEPKAERSINSSIEGERGLGKKEERCWGATVDIIARGK